MPVDKSKFTYQLDMDHDAHSCTKLYPFAFTYTLYTYTLAIVVTDWEMYCKPAVTLGINRSIVFFPSGAIQIFVVIDHPPVIAQVVEKSSDCRKRFVLAHSHRKPLRVLSGIGVPLISVSKYFTPSTIAQ